jgi:hypothetical protein
MRKSTFHWFSGVLIGTPVQHYFTFSFINLSLPMPRNGNAAYEVNAVAQESP